MNLRRFLKMKKAFSLFEMLLVLGLVSVCFVLFAKVTMNLSHFYDRQMSFDLANTNASLMIAEKILQNCLEFTPLNQGFECLLKDTQNLILQRQNALFIGSAGVVLKDENSTFYAPKSHFRYTLQNGLKAFNAGVLTNQNDLQGAKNNEFLHIYDKKERKIHKIKPLNKEKFTFTNDEFTGFYELVEAKVSLILQDDALVYHYTPYIMGISRKGVLLENVKKFSISENAGEFALKLCLNAQNSCLEKWILR